NMDSILHYTDPTLTLVATFSFVVCFLLGVWSGARQGGRVILPSLILIAISVYIRSQFPPLSMAAITAVSLMHVGAGALTALLVGRSKSKP
ncbi:MAG TPA: hypothetical protein PL112_21480, partial [Candidatus Obscuribacter sp.]|nr:hypothetical protein [Candidatus Obscuribacter sp.]